VLLSSRRRTDPARLAGAWARVRSQRRRGRSLQCRVGAGQGWFGEIVQILTEEGVPAEIAPCPLSSRCSTPGPGRAWRGGPLAVDAGDRAQPGLKVTRGNDDRGDVLKSTRAAAKMLRKNYRCSAPGRWRSPPTTTDPTVCGGRWTKRVDDLMFLIENYEKSTWGFASKNFYAEFSGGQRALTKPWRFTEVARPETAPTPASGTFARETLETDSLR